MLERDILGYAVEVGDHTARAIRANVLHKALEAREFALDDEGRLALAKGF